MNYKIYNGWGYKVILNITNGNGKLLDIDSSTMQEIYPARQLAKYVGWVTCGFREVIPQQLGASERAKKSKNYDWYSRLLIIGLDLEQRI